MFANSRVQAQRPGDPVLLHGSVAVWSAALGGQVAGPAVRQRRQDPVWNSVPSLGAPQSATHLYNSTILFIFYIFCFVLYSSHRLTCIKESCLTFSPPGVKKTSQSSWPSVSPLKTNQVRQTHSGGAVATMDQRWAGHTDVPHMYCRLSTLVTSWIRMF